MTDSLRELCAIYARPKRIMIIDDDLDFVELLRTLAAGFRCEFVFITKFQEAMTRISSDITDIDVVWIDLELNCGHTGEEVLAAVKGADRTKPVIIFSAHFDSARMDRISKIGVTFFLPKPSILNPTFFEEVFGSLRVPALKK